MGRLKYNFLKHTNKKPVYKMQQTCYFSYEMHYLDV